MTVQQLDEYHSLVKAIATKEAQIENLRRTAGDISSPSLEVVPHGSGISDRTANAAIEIADLEERLDYQRGEEKRLSVEIKAFIDAIDDDITRLVFKFRVLYGYSWQDVADTLGGYSTKGSVRSRYISHLKRAGIMEESDEYSG